MPSPKEFVKLTLGGQVYTFRSLDLDQLEELEPQFKAIDDNSKAPAGAAAVPKAVTQAVAEIAVASLQARHSGITVAQVRKAITIATLPTVMEAIRGVTSLDVDEGEAVAAQSTGTT